MSEYYTSQSELRDEEQRDEKSEYTIIKNLGEGSTAIVFLVSRGNMNYVMKVYKYRHTKSLDQKFQREVNTYRYITNSEYPNISPKYIDHFNAKRGYVLITEYLENYESINSFKFTIKDKMHICASLLYVINEMHMLGIAHRDIKPENFLVNSDTFDVKIIDFDVACVRDLDMELCNIPKGGTLGFNSKELGEYYSLRDKPPLTFDQLKIWDEYAVGMTLFEILTNIDIIDEYIPSDMSYLNHEYIDWNKIPRTKLPWVNIIKGLIRFNGKSMTSSEALDILRLLS